MADIDDLRIKLELIRGLAKKIERDVRMVKQLSAQADDILESYSLEEAQGNEFRGNTEQK